MIAKEIEQCATCGMCAAACPVYRELVLERYSPRGKVQLAQHYARGDLELSEQYRDIFSKCLLCGACKLTCANGIDPALIVHQMRREIAEKKGIEGKQKSFLQNLLHHHNITGEENEERADWTEDLEGLPENAYQKDRADVVFFVGCVASFFPMAQKVPQNMVRILGKADVDFTLLGGEEYCCGYPLVGAGLQDRARELIEHNQEKVEQLKAKKVVFTCPSCLMTWKDLYEPGVELMHATQFILELIMEGRLNLKGMGEKTVTYHDPCDLGRKGGVFDAPREIIKAIPSLTLIEMAGSKMNSVCCGGGGNLEMTAPDLVDRLAKKKIDDIRRTGADRVITACQQCVRTITSGARKEKSDLKVMDITELVCEAMES